MSASPLLRSRTSQDDFSWFQLLAKSVAGGLQEFLSGPAQLTASAGPAIKSRFSEWYPTQSAFGVLLPFELGKDADDIVIFIPGPLVSQALDLHYGGAGGAPVREAFTPSELRFLSRLAVSLVPHLDVANADAAPHPARPLEMQCDVHSFNWPRYRDSIVVADIQIAGPAIGPATISCFIGYARAKKIALRLAGSNPTQLPPQPEWQAKMRSAAQRVPIPARAVLTQADFPLSRLLALRAGDILPVMLPAEVPLYVAGRRFAHGSIGESNGRNALKIDYMEGPINE